MNTNDTTMRVTTSLLAFAAVFIFVRYCWPTVVYWFKREEEKYDKVLNQELLLEISPRTAVVGAIIAVLAAGAIAYGFVGGIIAPAVGVSLGLFIPGFVVRHLEQRRAARLEAQLVDGITVLASGVRAGLNLVQAMELLVQNGNAPLKQEFAQLLREYQMGLDLNHAMRNAATRIGSSNYRLLFTAIEMHRRRGGDTGESLDRIADSIREIQRLEGKLDSLTAQGRMQANMMAITPFALLAILYAIDPEDVTMLFTQTLGRLLLIFAAAMITVGFFWIRKIMSVDI